MSLETKGPRTFEEWFSKEAPATPVDGGYYALMNLAYDAGLASQQTRFDVDGAINDNLDYLAQLAEKEAEIERLKGAGRWPVILGRYEAVVEAARSFAQIATYEERRTPPFRKALGDLVAALAGLDGA